MSKELGYERMYFSTDGENYMPVYTKLHYYCPEDLERGTEIFNYEEIDSEMGFRELTRSITKQKYKTYHLGLFNVYPNQKLYIKICWENANDDYLTYKDLTESLFVKEFIDYLKDNGLSVCPLKGE